MPDSASRPWDGIAPPVAAEKPVAAETFGDRRVDPYDWLRDPGYPDVTDAAVLDHLKAENAYFDAVFGRWDAKRDALFAEMKARIKEDDSSVPVKDGPFWYQSRFKTGDQYPVFLRRPLESAGAETGPETILLDENKLAEGKDFLDVRDVDISPSHRILGYSTDYDGSERYTLRFRDVETGAELPDEVPNTSGGIVWAADDTTVFYAELDEQLRPKRIKRHVLGTDAADDVTVYEEPDETFWLGVGLTSDRKFVVIASGDKETSEARIVPADAPETAPRLVLARRAGHDYDVDHRDGRLWIRTNDVGRNFRIVHAPADAPAEANWVEHQAHSDAVYIRGFVLFRDFLVVAEREAGLPHLQIFAFDDGSRRRIDMPDPVYTAGLGANPEFETGTLRFSYQSMVRPASVFDIDMRTHDRTLRKTQEIPSGYDTDAYTSERSFATAPDGTRVPVSIVHRKDTPLGPGTPLILYGYGSYGITIDPHFSTTRLSLLDRGFVWAIAHVRGGSDLGRSWYDAGKLEHKENTFGDAIAVAEHLIDRGYTGAGRIAVMGGSAGGMLVGTLINRRPDLFHAALAQVPFVDVVNTMLDASLPLTPGEYTEWGNPAADAETYARIKAYSPYDNVVAQPYPHVMVTAGLSDPRVTYWEPAKWVAKLRKLKTDDRLLVLHTNMAAGHRGASGRWEGLKEVAKEYLFLLTVYGKVDTVPDAPAPTED